MISPFYTPKLDFFFEYFYWDGARTLDWEASFLELTRHVLAITLYRLFCNKSGRL